MLPESDRWAIHQGDCIPHMLEEMEPASMDMAVFSPPFPMLYAYTSEEADIGNSEDFKSEAKIHLGYFYRGLARVMKPGRVAMVHVMQVPRLKRSGGEGLHDFRGLNIRLAERAGMTFEYDWCVTKNPQAQAIRTKSKGLLFTQMHKDSVWSRPALADYILIFRAPGENAVPVKPDITNNEWIEWARPIWYGIRETDTLNVAEGREAEDERHICPLQLGTIERCVRLWSNKGETVMSPFAGIGSEGFVSVKQGRRFVGVELKPAYWRAGVRNLRRAENESKPLDMFAFDDAAS